MLMINTRSLLNTNMNINQGIPKDIVKILTTSIKPRTSITGTLIPSPISKIRSIGQMILLAMTQTTILIQETKVTVIPHTIMTINHNTTTEM